MKNILFKKKMKTVEENVARRVDEISGEFAFPSMADMMSEKDRIMVAEAQSRAMKKWWAALSAEQRQELVRRMKEGKKRASHENIAA